MSDFVVLGKGLLACRIALAIHASPVHKLLAVVPSMPESPAFSSLSTLGIDIGVQTVLNGSVEALHFPSAIAVCSSFNRIFQKSDLTKFSRILNIHYSLLPKYRGVRPINWSLEQGSTSHGVTLHEIDAGIDSGPILDQESFPIDSDSDEVIDVYLRCVEIGFEIFNRNLNNLANTVGRAQDETAASYFSLAEASKLKSFRSLSKSESRIQASRPL